MNARHLLLALLIPASGCSNGSKTATPTAPAQPVAAVETQTYLLKGVVREVDAKAGVVTIAHEDLPGFMKAMTMDFTPKDRSNLDEVGVGDEVEGPLEVTRVGETVKDYNLRSLEVTRPAPRTLKLDFGAGTVTLAPKPAVLTPGELVPDFAMTTQEGKPLRLSDLRGEIVVMTFIYTRCPLPDYCPAVDKKFRELADSLRSSRARADAVRLLSVSFDPEHDTAETLRKHADLQGAKPPLWTFAVASHDELRKVAERLGLTYGPMPNEIRHNLCTALIGPDGRLVRLETGPAGKSWTAAEMLKAIHSQMALSQK